MLDTGVQGSHKELLPNYDNQNSANTIPCNLLTRQFGPLGQKDCSSEDTEGHGTWVASRIGGAVNGFASNAAGVAALTLGAHPGLSPDALLVRLQSTARTDMLNGTGPNNPTDTGPSATAGPCTTGFCHLQYYTPGDPANPITFTDAYGAGMVNAGAAAAA